MHRTRLLPLALAALAAAFAASDLHAQVRDTIRLGGSSTRARPAPEPQAERGDSIRLYEGGEDAAEADTSDARPGRERQPDRWSRPFSVEGSGRATPNRPQREVVWVHPDSIRGGREEEVAEEDEDGSVVADSIELVSLDTAGAERTDAPRRSASTRRSSASEAEEEEGSSEARSARRSADEEGATGSSTRRSSSSSTRRSADAEESSETPRRSSSSTRRSADAEESSETPRRSSSSTRRAADEESEEGESRSTSSSTRRSADAESSESSRRAPAGGRARTHTVTAGETFYGIARRYGVTSAQLRAVNPDVEWQSLRTGTVLRLPANARAQGQASSGESRGSSSSSSRASSDDGERRTSAPQPTRSGRRTHTVAAGETLFGLARRYGVTVQAIRDANDLGEFETIRTGQTLVIPRPRD